MQSTKVFNNDIDTQTVLIPKEFQIKDNEVWIEKIRNSLTITPKPPSWDDFFDNSLKLSKDFKMERDIMVDEYINSSGNVFQDLGLSNSEERLAKAKLVIKIIELITKRGLNQKQAASLLEIDQPKVSALYHGRLSGFSISRLIKFLNLLEQDVEIIIRDKSDRLDHFGHLIVAV